MAVGGDGSYTSAQSACGGDLSGLFDADRAGAYSESGGSRGQDFASNNEKRVGGGFSILTNAGKRSDGNVGRAFYPDNYAQSIRGDNCSVAGGFSAPNQGVFADSENIRPAPLVGRRGQAKRHKSCTENRSGARLFSNAWK